MFISCHLNYMHLALWWKCYCRFNRICIFYSLRLKNWRVQIPRSQPNTNKRTLFSFYLLFYIFLQSSCCNWWLTRFIVQVIVYSFYSYVFFNMVSHKNLVDMKTQIFNRSITWRRLSRSSLFRGPFDYGRFLIKSKQRRTATSLRGRNMINYRQTYNPINSVIHI